MGTVEGICVFEGGSKKEVGDNYIKRSVMISTPHQML
jgi:hypothetical protein